MKALLFHLILLYTQDLVLESMFECTHRSISVAVHDTKVVPTGVISYLARIAIEMSLELSFQTNIEYADTSELRIRSGYACH